MHRLRLLLLLAALGIAQSTFAADIAADAACVSSTQSSGAPETSCSASDASILNVRSSTALDDSSLKLEPAAGASTAGAVLRIPERHLEPIPPVSARAPSRAVYLLTRRLRI